MSNFVIMNGNVINGLEFIGPFSEIEDAITYASSVLGDDGEWSIVLLREPVAKQQEEANGN